MDKINQIGKFFIILFTAGMVSTSIAAESYFVNQNSEAISEQAQDSEDKEGTTYIQAFDVVAQNVQLSSLSLIIPGEASFDILEPSQQIVATTFKVGSIRFFKILFRQIISPNAP